MIFFILGILPFILSSCLLFLKDPQIWPDEVLFFDTARNLSTVGNLATNIFNGAVPGLEIHAYWNPPLYFYLLSIWTNIFGISIEMVRFLSFLLAILSLLIIFLIIKNIFKSNWFGFIGIIIISTDMWFCRTARVGRMDMLSFFFLVLAIWLFLNRLYILTGIICGLAAVTHPLGFIAPMIFICYFLFTERNFKRLIIQVAKIAFPTIVIFFIWLVSMGNSFGLFVEQYSLQFLRKSTQTPFGILLFQGDIFWKIMFCIYGLLTIVLLYQWIKKHQKSDLFILIGIVTSVSLLMWGKEMWYLLYFQPFITFGLLSIVASSLKNAKSFQILTLLAVAVILIININFFITINNQFGQKENDYHQFTKLISEKLPKSGKIFLASIPDPYFDLKSNPNLTFFEFPPVPISKNAYLKLLNSADYLVINMIPNQIVADFIKVKSQETITISQPNGYSTYVIKVKK